MLVLEPSNRQELGTGDAIAKWERQNFSAGKGSCKGTGAMRGPLGKLSLPAQVACNLIFLTYSVEMRNPQMVSLSLLRLTTDTGHRPLHFNGSSGLAVGKKKNPPPSLRGLPELVSL